jgi:UV DNA damage endonuclease
MRPQLGLVCITQSKDVRYRMVTRKRLLELPPDGQRKLLDEIQRDNIQTLDQALRYCERGSISLYRILSSIFPFAREDVGRETLRPSRDVLADAGRYALERGIRLIMHPDQFVVLSSDPASGTSN